VPTRSPSSVPFPLPPQSSPRRSLFFRSAKNLRASKDPNTNTNLCFPLSSSTLKSGDRPHSLKLIESILTIWMNGKGVDTNNTNTNIAYASPHFGSFNFQLLMLMMMMRGRQERVRFFEVNIISLRSWRYKWVLIPNVSKRRLFTIETRTTTSHGVSFNRLTKLISP
jgi:hypothetical protein